MSGRWALILCGALMAAGLACAVLIKHARENMRETGALSVCVYDADTGEALEGARVVLPQYEKSFTTGKTGRTDKIVLRMHRAGDHDGAAAKDWGELTLLIYCEGYYPCALLNVTLRAGETREGPYVFLLPDDGTLAEPYALIESPPEEWVRALLAQYAP